MQIAAQLHSVGVEPEGEWWLRIPEDLLIKGAHGGGDTREALLTQASEGRNKLAAALEGWTPDAGRVWFAQAVCLLATLLGGPLAPDRLERECIAKLQKQEGAPALSLPPKSICIALVGACGNVEAWRPWEYEAPSMLSTATAGETACLRSSAAVVGVPAASCGAPSLPGAPRRTVGGICAAGGWGRDQHGQRRRLSSVEMLTVSSSSVGVDPTAPRFNAAGGWVAMPALRTARSGCRAVWSPGLGGGLTGTGQLFVMGGHGGARNDRQYCLDSVEALLLPVMVVEKGAGDGGNASTANEAMVSATSDETQWKPVTPMGHARAHFGAAALADGSGRLVVAGGCGSSDVRLACAELYHLRDIILASVIRSILKGLAFTIRLTVIG